MCIILSHCLTFCVYISILTPNQEKKVEYIDVFDSIVDCIIVGDTDADGNKNPYVIRFILNTGKEVKEVLNNNYKSIVQGNELICSNEEILNQDNENNHSLSNDQERLSLDNDGRSRLCRRKSQHNQVLPSYKIINE